jgi:hypothetical protein
MTYTRVSPHYMGELGSIVAGDEDTRYLDITNALDSTDDIATCTFTVLDVSGDEVTCTSNVTVDGGRVDFRLSELTETGWYDLKAVFVTDADCTITKFARFAVVSAT